MKKILACFLLMIISPFSYGLPFNIEADGPLPTTLVPGETVTAYYIVQNNTISPRNNNFVKHFPANTSQVTGPGLCGTTFDLAEKGFAGDSCLLQLSITGATNGRDTPLMVCFPGGLTCAGTYDTLHVTSGSSSNIRGVTGGTTTGGDNLLQTSLHDLQYWTEVTTGIPATSQTNDIDCTGSGNTGICVAGGVDNENTTGFISASTNGAQTWAAVSGLTNLANNTILGLSCSDNQICAAAGENTGLVVSTPYLAVTTSTATTWVDTGFTALPSSNTTLADAACAANGSICVAVGQIPSFAYPFIIYSSTPQIPSSWATFLISPAVIARFATTSCTNDGGLCIAAGGINAGPNNIYQTTTLGTTWPIGTSSTSTLMTDSSCTGSGSAGWCVAVGADSSNTGQIFITSNTGSSWSNVTPSNATNLYLTGASCTGTISSGVCVVVGYNTSSSTPYIAYSQNAGGWTTINNANIEGTLSASNTLSKVSCSGSGSTASCIAVGQDLINNTALLLESFDSGQSWTVNPSAAFSTGSYDAVSVTGG